MYADLRVQLRRVWREIRALCAFVFSQWRAYLPQVREPEGAQSCVAVWRRWGGGRRQGEFCILRPGACLIYEALGAVCPWQEGTEVKLTNSSAKADLLRRVRRIEGQALGVAKMIE